MPPDAMTTSALRVRRGPCRSCSSARRGSWVIDSCLEKFHQLKHCAIGIIEAHKRLLAAGETWRYRIRDELHAVRFKFGHHRREAFDAQANPRDARVAEVGVRCAVRIRRLPFD